MSEKVADVHADLSLHTSGFMREISKAIKAVRTAGKQMSDAIGSEGVEGLKDIQNETKKTSKKLKKIVWNFRGSFKDIGRVWSGIVMSQAFYRTLNAIQNCTQAIIEFNAELENANISFKILLGSAKEATRFIYALEDFAADTPFEFQDAEIGARRLMAVGFSAKATIPIMRTVSDMTAVVGGGTDTLERITRALGQIQTKGRLMAEEMRQLHEAMVPAAQILRDELGLTYDQLANIGKMKIPADVAISALLTGINKRYGGAAKMLESTTNGLMNKIKDMAKFLSVSLFAGPLEGFRENLQHIADLLDKAFAATRKNGVEGFLNVLFSPSVAIGIMAFIRSMRAVVTSIKNLWKATAPIRSAVGSVFSVAFGIAATVVSTFINILARLITAILELGPVIRHLATMIASLMVAKTVFTALVALRGAIAGLSIAAAVAKAVNALSLAISTLTLALYRNPVTGLIAALIGIVTYLIVTVASACGWLDTLSKKIAVLLGLNTKTFSAGSDEYDKAIEEYNQSLQEALKSTIKVGDAATDTGKKINDTFLASFDEVFTIPNKLDDSADAINELGDLVPDIPPIPKVPEVDPSTKDDEGGVDHGPLDDLLDKLAQIPPLIKKIPRAFRITYDLDYNQPGVPVEAIDELKIKIRSLATEWGRLVQVIRDFGESIINAPNPIADWLRSMGEALQGLPGALGDVLDSVTNYLGQKAGSISGWFSREFSSAMQSISAAVPLLLGIFQGILSGARSAISGVLNGISTALDNASKSISDWGSRVGRNLNEGAQSISDWGTRVKQSLGKGLDSISGWGMDGVRQLRAQIDAWTVEATRKLAANGVTIAKAVGAVMLTALAAIVLMITGGGLVAAASAGAVSIGTAIVTGLAGLALLIAPHFDEIVKTVKTKFEAAKTAVVDTYGKLSTATEETVRNLKGGWDILCKDTADSLRTTVENVKQDYESLKTYFSTWWTDSLNKNKIWLQQQKADTVVWLQSIRDGWDKFWKGVEGGASKAGSAIKTVVKGWINNIISLLNALIRSWNKLSFNVPKVEIAGKVLGGTIIKVPTVSTIPRLAKGGIATKNTIANIAEAGKPEAIMPLSESSLAPFADMLVARMPKQEAGSDLPPVYVGTLIADDKGIRELERRMRIVRVSETKRIVGGGK